MLCEPDQRGDLRQADRTFLSDVLARFCLPPSTRLHPLQGGRTSRVWQVEQDNGPPLILKVTRAEDGTSLFPNMPELEWAAMVKLSPLGIAPFPVAIDSSACAEKAILTQAAHSTTVSQAAPIAELLARIHAVVPWQGLPIRATDPETVLREGDAMLDEAGNPAWLIRMRPRPVEDPVSISPTLVHRDLVPANTATIAGTLIALDWQCPALGDPVEDLTHASSPAMQSLADHYAPVCAADLVRAYQDQHIQERFRQMEAVYRWRMACYCSLQDSKGANGYARARELECAALEQAYSEPTQ